MAGASNLITDVPGLRVGNAHDPHVASGVTVIIPDRPAIAAVDVRGGGTGTRDTEALGLAGTVEDVHAIVLSGGSAFGLSAATGVQSWLAERNIGFAVGAARVPIVPQAILFDLLNGGDKTWGPSPPYERLGREACARAGLTFGLGSIGAGYGATTATLRGGLGSASAMASEDLVVGAVVAANPVGTVTVGATRHFWAAALERDGEFGGLGLPSSFLPEDLAPRLKGGPPRSTTIAVVATNARLTKPQAYRLAVMAQTGLPRAIQPVHSPLDGDIVFAMATGERPLSDPVRGLALLGAEAANVLARAIARGVFHASPAPPGWTGPPAWTTRFGGGPS